MQRACTRRKPGVWVGRVSWRLNNSPPQRPSPSPSEHVGTVLHHMVKGTLQIKLRSLRWRGCVGGSGVIAGLLAESVVDVRTEAGVKQGGGSEPGSAGGFSKLKRWGMGSSPEPPEGTSCADLWILAQTAFGPLTFRAVREYCKCVLF